VKTKEQLLLEIERLKALKPWDYLTQIRWILRKLRYLEGDEY